MAEDIANALGQREPFWEETDPKKRADAIWENVERIDRAEETRHLNDLLHASLFGNAEQFGFTPKSYGKPVARAHARLSLNVVRNMVNAVVSKIAAKNKVHPKFLTSGGEPSQARRAKQMEKVVGGIFYETKFYRTQRMVFRDLAIYGTGFVRPWMDERQRTVTIERVPPTDILVDAEESRYGDPHTIYHRKYYDKYVLAKMFPGSEKLDIIRRAGTRANGESSGNIDTDATVDTIPVIETFRRPSVPGGDDGIRVVSVDSGELGSCPWNHDYTPFPKIVWTAESEGFFGTGLAYELAGIQSEINDILTELAKAHRLIKGFWATDHNAKVLLKHFSDDLGRIIRFSGTIPTYVQPNAIPPDTYKYLWDLYAKAFEIAGISQLQASGMKPAGLNSGEAQRVYDDIQTERFLDVGMHLEDWTMDVTEQALDRARDLAQGDGGFTVRAKTDTGMEVIDFLKDADLPKNDYLIQVFPTSLLPTTPAGRLAFLNDLVTSGVIKDQGAALKLLGFPDLESFMARENAPRELLERNIERILDQGEWVAPEPLDDHELALAEIPLALAQARNKKTEKERLSMLRRYVVLTARLKKMQESGEIAGAVTDADPGAAPDGPPPGPPPGPGGPPPPPPGEPMAPPAPPMGIAA